MVSLGNIQTSRQCWSFVNNVWMLWAVGTVVALHRFNEILLSIAVNKAHLKQEHESEWGTGYIPTLSEVHQSIFLDTGLQDFLIWPNQHTYQKYMTIWHLVILLQRTCSENIRGFLRFNHTILLSEEHMLDNGTRFCLQTSHSKNTVSKHRH